MPRVDLREIITAWQGEFSPHARGGGEMIVEAMIIGMFVFISGGMIVIELSGINDTLKLILQRFPQANE